MGFGQEMKDFLGAAQGVTKMFDDHSYNKVKSKYMDTMTNKIQQDMDDPLKDELQKANIAHVKAGTASLNASTGLSGKRGALLDAQTAMYRGAGQQPDPVAAGITGPSNLSPNVPAVGGPTASPPTQQPAQPQQQSAIDPDQSQGDPTQFAATGGMVQPAIGGDDNSDDDDDDSTTSPSTSSTAPAQFSTDAAHDAIRNAYDYAGTLLGPRGAVPTPARIRTAQALAHGYGAAPLADMQAIYKKIDPNNQMSDSARNMAALSAVYQFKLNQGDPQGAQRAAFQMLQHYRLATQRYAAISAAAANQGNPDAAAKAAMKAYANIPDGKDLKVVKAPNGQLQYSYTDDQGHVISQGLATPQQLGAAAMGVAQRGFDQFLSQAANERQAKSGAVGGPKPMKPGDKDKVLTSVGNAYQQQFPDNSDGSGATPDEEARALKGAAYRISINPKNQNLTPDEAVDAAKRLMSPNAKNPDKADFTTKKLDDEDGGGYEIRFGKQNPIHLTEDEFDALAERRAAKMAGLKKAKDAAAKPGIVADTGKAVSDYADDLEKNGTKQAFPGGSTRAPDDSPKKATPDDDTKDRRRPYVPLMAGGKKAVGDDE